MAVRGRSEDDHGTITERSSEPGGSEVGGSESGLWNSGGWRLEADQAGLHRRLEARSLKAEQAGGWRLEAEGSKGNQGTIIVAIRGRSATINRRSVHDQSGDTKFRAAIRRSRQAHGRGRRHRHFY